MTSVDIKLADIKLGHRLRATRDNLVTRLAESMNKRGLLQPITVRAHIDGGYLLVIGWHRVEAAKLLAWSTIAATVTHGQRPERFAKTSVGVPDLLQLSRFLEKFATVKAVKAEPAPPSDPQHSRGSEVVL
jgi:hypothetical protein